MKKPILISLLLVLGMTFVVQAQDEVIERPEDVKSPKIDGWKNASFDLYDKVREVESQAGADAEYDAVAGLGTLTDEIIVLLGKSAIMLKEVKTAPKLKLLKYTKSVKDSGKALKWCKEYANSVLGEGTITEEGDGK